MVKVTGKLKRRTARDFLLYMMVEYKKKWRPTARETWRKRRYWLSWEYSFAKYGRYDENIRLDLGPWRVRVRLKEPVNGR